jgi:phosphatidylglycerol:prolipoprotein diacylglycerol transferase
MCPTIFHIGGFELRAYAFFIALGGLLAFFFLKTRERGMGLDRPDAFWTLVNAVMLSGFLGARGASLLFRMPFGPGELRAALFAVNSGFSVFGFIAGVLAGGYLFARAFGYGPARVLDYVCAALPLWQAFGRLGCFFRGCCYGLPAGGARWALAFYNPDSAVPPELLGVPLHPAQLYEAAGSVLLFAALYAGLDRVEKGRLPRGSVCAAYCAGYGVIRFACEFFRAGGARPWGLPLTAGQLLAAALALGGAGFFAAVRRRAKKSVE